MHGEPSMRTSTFRVFLGFVCLLNCALVTAQESGSPAKVGPWDVASLKQTPKITWVDSTGPLRKLYYENEPRNGKPTRVFAYCAFPDEPKEKAPAVVLIHGGGGKAFPEWAKLWADRGYVALAMDLAGKDADGKPLADGGPDQTDTYKLPQERTDLKEMWTYHAVAACVRGTSVLASLPEVDPQKIGATGISWGGYLTCIVVGVDDRLQFAVPVYGCGFLQKNSAWLKQFEAMPEDWRAEWHAAFDPSKYVGLAKMPILFVNGTNDFAYPLDSYQETYQLAARRKVCVTVNMPHGHPQGWAPIEIGRFADYYVRNGTPLPAIRAKVVKSETKSVLEGNIDSSESPATVQFHWTTDKGAWQTRKWQSKAVETKDAHYETEIPTERPIVFFATVKDGRGLTTSSEHVELKE